MRCPNCKHEMQMTRGDYEYRESGLENVWLENWPVLACRKCGIQVPLLPDPEEMAKTITHNLVLQKGPLNGDSIVFLRKAMGLAAGALAEVLEVNRVSVSRWENNKQQIDGLCDFRLRLQAIDKILPDDLRPTVRDAVVGILAGGYSQQRPLEPIRIPGETAAQVSSHGGPVSMGGWSK